MKKVFEITDEELRRQLNSKKDHQPSEFFAENVMERIFREQMEALNKPSWKDLILFRPVFRYALFSAFLLYPAFVSAHLHAISVVFYL